MRFYLVWSAALATALACAHSSEARAQSGQMVERGKYLVQLGGCSDCHTPGHFFGNPDMSRYLAGSDVGLEVPGLGTFVGRNLTPDQNTGLGKWTDEEITTALQTGVRPDGRLLAPMMPWRAYAGLTKSDAAAIVAYLRSLPPVSHKVPGPFAADDKPAIFRMTLSSPESIGEHH
jgi:mono/diheme cytochrome c family protein